jgi:diguanylate cyclase (GGDEF)-like protein
MIDLANRDPLTGLANRRRLELELDRQIELARQTDNPLAVIMMDLDNFKTYNDTAGHLAGDNLLRTVADALRARTRITDLVVRWGGDEFCILIPYTPPDRAVAAARSLMEAVTEAARGLPVAADLVGASAGVACFPDDAQGATELIAAADAALYQVKESGRGHVLRLGSD